VDSAARPSVRTICNLLKGTFRRPGPIHQLPLYAASSDIRDEAGNDQRLELDLARRSCAVCQWLANWAVVAARQALEYI
jgi:hypothetical protein